MRILSFLLLLFSLQVAAVTQAPQMLRACLNNDDSTLTISWKSVEDACGSFTDYTLYGNKDLGPYQRIATITDRMVSSHSFKLDDLNTNRRYYITVHDLCDGLDSATSAILTIDLIKPTLQPLKRVSYDTSTQEIFAEWYTNPAPDTEGYRIYRNNSGVNDSIGQTTDTVFVVSPAPGVPFDVTHAAYDSCALFSPISSSHRAVFLQGSIDTCARSITLSWTLYKGWSFIDSQSLHLSINGAYFNRHTSFNSSTTSYTYTNLQLGDTFCFHLVSYTNDGGVVQSYSNNVCFSTRAFIVPDVYLANASLDLGSMSQASIDWYADQDGDVDVYRIYSATGGGPFSSAMNVPRDGNSSYRWDDQSSDPTAASISYYIDAVDRCGDVLTSTSEARTIYLQKVGGQGTFNAYINWDGGVEEYLVEYSDDNGSTWNSYGNQAAPTAFDLDDAPYCYRVLALEGPNSFGNSATSVSNYICELPSLKVFAPETMVIGGKNNRFVIRGVGIDHSRSSFQVYNRWGQRIVELPTDQAWYGDYMGEMVGTGLYPFVITVVGLKGENEQIKGVLRIIE